MNASQQLTRIVEPGIVATLNRSELDGQIATARQFPRDLQLFVDRSRSLATIDEATAAECVYALPRDNKIIEGPSVRLAEILVANYGNCRTGARIIEEGEEFVTAQGIFHDLESNTTTTFETRRRITTRSGKRYNADMIATTCNAACAIALRQAVLKGIPKPLWDRVYEEARARAVGDLKGLPEKRARAVKAFEPYGIDQARILKTLDLAKVEDIDADALAKLRGLFSAIKEGELTAEGAFPTDATKNGRAKTLDEFAKPDGIESPADAFEIGRQARLANAKRTQWPGAWRDQSNIDAWLAGFDAQDEEMKGGQPQ